MSLSTSGMPCQSRAVEPEKWTAGCRGWELRVGKLLDHVTSQHVLARAGPVVEVAAQDGVDQPGGVEHPDPVVADGEQSRPFPGVTRASRAAIAPGTARTNPPHCARRMLNSVTRLIVGSMPIVMNMLCESIGTAIPD